MTYLPGMTDAVYEAEWAERRAALEELHRLNDPGYLIEDELDEAANEYTTP